MAEILHTQWTFSQIWCGFVCFSFFAHGVMAHMETELNIKGTGFVTSVRLSAYKLVKYA